jgi:Lon protease-like protein
MLAATGWDCQVPGARFAVAQKSSSVVPVFPLPEVVFFPETTLPLHIFEPRYVQMVEDAVAGNGLIAMALLQPGWERDYGGRPPINSIGTFGRIEDLQSLPGGRFDLRLVGLQRVEFEEIESDRPYRVARTISRPELPINEMDAEVQRLKLDLLASQSLLDREVSGGFVHGIVLDESVSFTAAINRACAELPVEPELRQSLLEESDLLERHRRVSELGQRVLELVLRLKNPGESAQQLLN